jgi:hypothetical protein
MTENQRSLNVVEFGAVGDGCTDNTAALQAAIEAAAETQATLYVPAGVFLTGTLRWRTRVGMRGDPTWSFGDFGGSILRLNDDKARCLIDLTGALGATLDGLCLDGASLGTGIHGVLVDKSDYGKTEDTPRIERCRVSRFTGDGVRLKRIWCFSVRSCMLSHNGGHGIWVRGWDGFLLDNWLSGNGGAGYAAEEENLSVTLTGNRIEWNRGGGIVSRGGGHYNITGNYIDRSGGPGIWFAPRGSTYCSVISAVGNVIYRSGRPEWCPADDPHASCHARFEECRGLVFSGNSLNVSMDDRGRGQLSPRIGIVLRRLASSVVKDNVMHCGALERLVEDLGGHGEGVVVADNVGTLFTPGPTPLSDLNSAWADPAW